MTDPANGSRAPEPSSRDGTNNTSVVCSRCRTENSSDAEVCSACRSFLPRNQVARITGIYARYQPPDMTAEIDTFKSGVISDRGGESELSTLEHAYVDKLGDIDRTIRLLTYDIAVNGLLMPSGRVREVYEKLLAGLAAFDRYAQRIGMERRAKQIDLAAAIAEHQERNR
jgi:ribosomal protein L40E